MNNNAQTVPTVDLLGLIGRDVSLKKAAATGGGEFSGPCPFCGGRDRFRVWPNAAKPNWWCRQCDRKGDAIDYVRQRDGLTFREACAALGQPTGWRSVRDEELRALVRGNRQSPPVDEPPAEKWQQQARDYITKAERQLWNESSGADALSYLRERRGLTDETIKRWRLGYWPEDQWGDPTEWGLAGKKVWRPKGILIPCEVAGTVWYVTTRRPMLVDGQPDDLARYIGGAKADNFDKYFRLRGSVAGLFGADGIQGRSIAVLTEGEFDAMLLHQVTGDLVDVVTMGGAATPMTGRWLTYLFGASRVVAAYDTDDAGVQGAERLAALSRRVRVAVLPGDTKDLTTFHVGGGDLRGWLVEAVARHSVTPASAAVTEIDQGDGDRDMWPTAIAQARTVMPQCVPGLERLRNGGMLLLERDGRILVGPPDDLDGCQWASVDEWRTDYKATIGDLTDTWNCLLSELIQVRESA